MIQGFEDLTHALTEYELNTVVPAVVRGLQKRNGKASRITNREMVEKMKEHGYEVSEPRLRKVINHIRNNGLVPCLVASEKGYYVATDPEDLKRYISSLMGREKAIKQVRESMQKDLTRMVIGKPFINHF
jgi:5-formaminoimidazole-4-carboxamide-1-beta-D-ribofuranosyl 5'-monophosphate synthetase